LTIPAARRIWQTWETAPEVVQAIDALLNEHTDQQIAVILNERGLHPGKGGSFKDTVGELEARSVLGWKTRFTDDVLALGFSLDPGS
jgi:hypothetical protein